MFVKYYFSSSTNGFYQDDIHPTSSIPSDAKEITLQRRDELLSLNADQGKVITADASNDPIAVDPDDLMTPAELVDKKLKKINPAYEEAMKLIRSDYPQSEIDGWAEQSTALNEFDAAPSADNILLDELANANGLTRAQMAESIRSKRNAYLMIYGKLTGKRQALRDTLNAIDINAADAKTQIAAIDENELITLANSIAAGA